MKVLIKTIPLHKIIINNYGSESTTRVYFDEYAATETYLIT